MAPYLLFGFLAAGVLSVLISPETVQRYFGGRGIGPVVKAAIFGVPLPLCSCGVIPVAASFRKHGASRGATTAFLISTPQTGVDSILVTYSLLGGVFAVFRPLAALVNGIVGGMLVTLLGPHDVPEGHGSANCRDTCCADAGKHGRVYRALRFGFVTLPQDIGRSLLVGLVVAGIISVIVPDDYFAGLPGGGMGTMLLMILVGIPMYVCATASVPIAAALIAKGISPGAALVFLMTGPATNGATVATVWNVLGRRVAVIYLLSIALTALLSGTVLDHVFTISGSRVPLHVHGALPGYVNTVCALALLAVMGVAILRPAPVVRGGEGSAKGASEQTVRLAVTGMTCHHCAESVRRALAGCSGVNSVHVDLRRRCASVTGRQLDRTALRLAVEGLGYGVGEELIEGQP